MSFSELFVSKDVIVVPFPVALIVNQINDAGTLHVLDEFRASSFKFFFLDRVVQLVSLVVRNQGTLVVCKPQTSVE